MFNKLYELTKTNELNNNSCLVVLGLFINTAGDKILDIESDNAADYITDDNDLYTFLDNAGIDKTDFEKELKQL